MQALFDVVLAVDGERRRLELSAELSGVPVRILTPEEALGGAPPTFEDADGFEATAERRARGLCRVTGLVCVAEVNGLVVEALGGRPGLRSARLAGERATDAENNAALLAALEDVEDEERGAQLRCLLALAAPWRSDVVVTAGALDGRIARTAKGSGGFGYEPLFVVGDDGRVLAELDEAARSRLSPSARAARALVEPLADLVDAALDQCVRVVG